MKPHHIYLVRHGESEGNVDRAIHATVPDWRIPLTELGRKQARETGCVLFDQIPSLSLAVYLSPYLRTRQTWQEMETQSFQVDVDVKEDPRLREQEWGNLRAYVGRTWADIEAERDAYGSFFYRFLCGESGADVYDRCTGFLDTLYRDFENPGFPENVLIVTHGYTLRVLLMRWLHWPIEDFHRLRNPKNGQMFEMRRQHDDRYALTEAFPLYEGSTKLAP